MGCGRDRWDCQGEKNYWATIEVGFEKTKWFYGRLWLNKDSDCKDVKQTATYLKGCWVRAKLSCWTGREHRDRSTPQERQTSLISVYLGDSGKRITQTHPTGKLLACEYLGLTDSTFLWLTDPAFLLCPKLCHLQQLSSSVWTTNTTLPNPDPD